MDSISNTFISNNLIKKLNKRIMINEKIVVKSIFIKILGFIGALGACPSSLTPSSSMVDILKGNVKKNTIHHKRK